MVSWSHMSQNQSKLITKFWGKHYTKVVIFKVETADIVWSLKTMQFNAPCHFNDPLPVYGGAAVCLRFFSDFILFFGLVVYYADVGWNLLLYL